MYVVSRQVFINFPASCFFLIRRLGHKLTTYQNLDGRKLVSYQCVVIRDEWDKVKASFWEALAERQFFFVGPFAGHPTSHTSILIRGQFQFQPSFLNSYLRFGLSASHFKSVYTCIIYYSIPPLVATHLKQPPSRIP